MELLLDGPTRLQRLSEGEIAVTRTFDAPAHILFEAWTRPDLVKRWWAPASQGATLPEAEADVRAGGSYRYVLAFADGNRLPVTGGYLEVEPGARLVFTQQFADEPVVHVAITFTEADGKTTVVDHERYASKEALDGSLAVGMADGIREAWDQIHALVGTLV
jgi:uncharacterized protein YndB with AHSA1/START domain